jgi:hypothetical protein
MHTTGFLSTRDLKSTMSVSRLSDAQVFGAVANRNKIIMSLDDELEKTHQRLKALKRTRAAVRRKSAKFVKEAKSRRRLARLRKNSFLVSSMPILPILPIPEGYDVSVVDVHTQFQGWHEKHECDLIVNGRKHAVFSQHSLRHPGTSYLKSRSTCRARRFGAKSTSSCPITIAIIMATVLVGGAVTEAQSVFLLIGNSRALRQRKIRRNHAKQPLIETNRCRRD